MEADHSSGTPSSRQRPMVDAVTLERVPSVHEQGSCELIGRPYDAAPKLSVRLHPGRVPQVQAPVSDGVRDHPPLPRRAETLGSSHQITGMHVRRPPSPSRPGRLAAVSSSTWPCRPSSRPTCAPLVSALVIPGALFVRRFAIGLFRFTHVLCSGEPREAVAEHVSRCCLPICSLLPQRPHPHPVARTPSHLSRAKPKSLTSFGTAMNPAIPLRDAIGERQPILPRQMARCLRHHFA